MCTNTNYSEFCKTYNSYQCSAYYTYKGYCTLNTFTISEMCMLIDINYYGDC